MKGIVISFSPNMKVSLETFPEIEPFPYWIESSSAEQVVAEQMYLFSVLQDVHVDAGNHI